MNAAGAFIGTKDYDRAIVDFNRYVASPVPSNDYKADAYNFLGTCYKNKNDSASSLANYTKAITLLPAALYYFNRGKMHAQLKAWPSAIADYTSAIGLQPIYPSAYFNRGYAYYNSKDNVNAMKDYTKTIEQDPAESEAYYNRAVIYDARKEYNSSISDYNIYIDQNKHNIAYLADGYQNRGRAYSSLGNHVQGLKDLNTAIDLEPKTASRYTARAIIYRKLNKIPEATADEAKATSLK